MPAIESLSSTLRKHHMVTFFFEVCKSFMESSNHPITIPRQHNDNLIKNVLNGSEKTTVPVSIIPPDKGRKLDGHIYYGISGYGPYYQIRIIGTYPGWYLGNLTVGDIIYIKIFRNSSNQASVQIMSPNEIQNKFERMLNDKKPFLRKLPHPSRSTVGNCDKNSVP